MPDFKLVADFEPTGDQPQAIDKLADGLARGLRHQTLLGATGTGKSLAPDEPVYVGRQDDYGRITWSVEPIGPLVDTELGSGRVYQDDHGTEVAFPTRTRPGLLVMTVDPVDHSPSNSAGHRRVAPCRSVPAVAGRDIRRSGCDRDRRPQLRSPWSGRAARDGRDLSPAAG